jgi:hypothetical protein
MHTAIPGIAERNAMTAHAARIRSARLRRSGIAVFAAALGLASLAVSPGVSYAAGMAHHRGAEALKGAGSGVPELLTPTVKHEPDAYELLGVGCSSVTYCVAVGYGDGTFKGGVAVPIKNGVPGKPILSSDSSSVFRAAACVSTSECIIAGDEVVGRAPDTTALVWLLKGTKLTVLPQSTPVHYITGDFDGATCRGTTCEVVGNATYLTSTKAQQPIGLFAGLRLHGSPSVDEVQNDSLGYASSVSCPSGPVCWVGGATAAGQGAEAWLSPANGKIRGPFGQASVSGIDGLACMSYSACGAAEIENITFGQTAGWVERLNQLSHGTPVKVAAAQLMLGIAALNQSYYLAVGSSGGDDWLADLMSAAGKPRTPVTWSHAGYLQAVSCPVQTECIAVGFTKDPSTKQPGGVAGVDGAIEIFRLRTAPSAPGLKVAGKTTSSVRLRITAPRSNGGVAVTSYDLIVSRCKPHHSGCHLEAVKTLTLSGRSRAVTVTHLAAKATYYFEIRAVNAIGAGPYSAKVHATP